MYPVCYSKYPNRYFDRVKRAATDYHKNPPGILDVNRLIESKDSWRNIKASSSAKQPKTLILADEFVAQWTGLDIKNCHKILERLSADGFRPKGKRFRYRLCFR